MKRGLVVPVVALLALVLGCAGHAVRVAPAAKSPPGVASTPHFHVTALAQCPTDPREDVAALVDACDRGDANRCDDASADYFCGAGVARDVPRAIALATRGCERGLPSACTRVGELLTGVESPSEVQREEAARFAKKGCDGGDDLGCHNYAAALLLGLGIRQDAALAASIFEKQCTHGYDFSCSNIAILYTKGNGVAKDMARALALGRPACERGDLDSCSVVGHALLPGVGGPEDVKTAASLLTRACDGNVAAACGNLGVLYLNGVGVERDVEKAQVLLRRACDAGNEGACTMATEARNAPPGDPGATNRGALEKGCDRGEGGSCNGLGRIWREGLGVTKDAARAHAYFDRSCGLGDGEGCSGAGGLFLGGEGVAKDAGRARQLFDRGCELGSGKACGLLAACWMMGWGGAKDPARARQLLDRGCRLGAKDVCETARSIDAGEAACRSQCASLEKRGELREGVTLAQCITDLCTR